MSKQNGGIYKSPVRTTSKEDIPVVKNTIELNFEGDVTVVDDSCGKATVTIGTTGTPEGKLYDFSFVNTGATYNKWLEFDSSSSPSNQVPEIIPYDSELLALTYSNSDDDTEINAEIYINGILIFTWEIRNKRTAWKTDLVGAVSAAQGDRLSIFFRQADPLVVTPASRRPSDVVFSVFLTFTSASEGEGGTQFGV